MRAEGTPPRAVPSPRPYRFAPWTGMPAIVDAVCEPWPNLSAGVEFKLLDMGFRLYALAPITLL